MIESATMSFTMEFNMFVLWLKQTWINEQEISNMIYLRSVLDRNDLSLTMVLLNRSKTEEKRTSVNQTTKN